MGEVSDMFNVTTERAFVGSICRRTNQYNPDGVDENDVSMIATAQQTGRRLVAEGVGFEPTNGCPLPVFKTGAIDHSATLPMRG